MATLTTSNAPYNSTNAIFQAWGSGIDGAFTTFGWVRTSDTGQVNWTTVPFPTVANSSQGYSIFKMADSLQGTYPCFIKIEYGSFTPALNPGLWITIGTGSDGSGNITGILKARLQIAPWNNVNTSWPSYFSGSADRYCAVLWPIGSNNYYYTMFSIERTKNASGATTGDGLMFFTNTYITGTGTSCHYLPFSGTVPPSYANWNCNIPQALNPSVGGAFKNTTAMYPVKCWTPGESGPSTNIFLYTISDFTASVNNTVQLTLFDGAITGAYLPMLINTPSQCFFPPVYRGPASNISLAMRWE